jgi:hypothetical protein
VNAPGITRLDVLRHDRDTTTATLARLRETLATTQQRRPLEIRTRLDIAEDIRRTGTYLAALEREIAAVESGAAPTRVPGEATNTNHARAQVLAQLGVALAARRGRPPAAPLTDGYAWLSAPVDEEVGS